MGREFLSETNNYYQPQLPLPWVCMRDSCPYYNFLPSSSSLSPAKPVYQKRREYGKEMKEHLWYLLQGFSINISYWDGSWESWMGSELLYQNLQHQMEQKEDSLTQEGRKGPHFPSVSFTSCFLSRTEFLSRPTAYYFCTCRGEYTGHLLANTLSYVNNCL